MTAPDRSTPPPVAPLAAVSIAPATVVTLPGGAALSLTRGGDQPIVKLCLMWQGGRLDCPDQAAYNVMCDCLLEGSRDFSDSQIADAVDFTGARLSVQGHDHFTSISLTGLAGTLPSLFDIIRSVIVSPLLADRSIDVARKRLATAAAIRLAKVSARADDAARLLIAGEGHPSAHVVTPQELSGVTTEAVRRAWRLTVGSGSAALRAFLGGAYSDSLAAQVSDFISSLPPGESPVAPLAVVSDSPAPAQTVTVVMPEAIQSAVVMALPTVNRDHPDYIPLRLAVTALGGYFGSRLMANIREKRGLTYGISASLLGAREGAAMHIAAQCSPGSVQEVIECTRAEIRSLWENPLSPDETERLRRSAWSALAAQSDSPLSTMDYYVTQLLVNTPADYFARSMEAIRTLSPESVARMARRYFDAPLRIAVAGPAQKL